MMVKFVLKSGGEVLMGRDLIGLEALWDLNWRSGNPPAGRLELEPAGSLPLVKKMSSPSWIFLLAFRGCLNKVKRSSYAQVMAKMVKYNFLLASFWDLEAWMIGSFALEMRPELVLDARF
ncbi:hypothetical protein Tco_0655143, partial [Tanacetum coccineum]